MAPLVLHTGSIATALEPGCDAVAELIDADAATSTISFDPNIRSAFFEDAEQALSRVETVVARSDVVKASDEDMRWLDPHSSPEELAARWLTLGPSIVAVTFGAHGSFAICADGDERIPAYPAEVVDTVGAGDAFMTGLIDALWDLGLLGGHRRGQLRDIRADVPREVLKVAALSAAADRRTAGRRAAGPGHPRSGGQPAHRGLNGPHPPARATIPSAARPE